MSRVDVEQVQKEREKEIKRSHYRPRVTHRLLWIRSHGDLVSVGKGEDRF